MGKVKPITLPSGRHWAKKGDALTHFKDMLNRYSVGDFVKDQRDHADLAALIAVYDSVLAPGLPTKAGTGVDHFEKRWDIEHPGNTACFFVVRTDGTSIDFSTVKALDAAASASK